MRTPSMPPSQKPDPDEVKYRLVIARAGVTYLAGCALSGLLATNSNLPAREAASRAMEAAMELHALVERAFPIP